jgi:hypothetical protein
MIAMSLSQAAAWWLVLQHDKSLFEVTSQIAAFNCFWAFCNRYIAGRIEEHGHWSMAVLALISLTERRNYAFLATCIVLLNLEVSLGAW